MESTTRRLRKYEADTTPTVVDTIGEAMECFTPFGPMIARFSLPQDLVDRINAYADAQVAEDKSTEFLLPAELVTQGGEQSLVRRTASLVRRYLARAEGSPAERVDFDVFWIVSQYAGTPSPAHFHSGDVAGVLYLKVPQIDAAEEESSYIAGRQAGYINFIIGGKQRLSKSLISFKPQVGDIYLFPGWLLHVAEPFRGSGERRSMAFNAVVADDRS
jgi:hypothetical protein